MKDINGIMIDVNKSVSSITNVAYSIEDAMVDMCKLINDEPMPLDIERRLQNQSENIKHYRNKLNIERNSCADHLERINSQKCIIKGLEGRCKELSSDSDSYKEQLRISKLRCEAIDNNSSNYVEELKVERDQYKALVHDAEVTLSCEMDNWGTEREDLLEVLNAVKDELNTVRTSSDDNYAAEIYNLREQLKNANDDRSQLMAKMQNRDIRIEGQNAKLEQLAGMLVDRDTEIGVLRNHMTNVSNAINYSDNASGPIGEFSER